METATPTPPTLFPYTTLFRSNAFNAPTGYGGDKKADIQHAAHHHAHAQLLNSSSVADHQIILTRRPKHARRLLRWRPAVIIKSNISLTRLFARHLRTLVDNFGIEHF